MDAELVAAATEQAAAVAVLHELNAQSIRAFVESDVAWYEENPARRPPASCRGAN